MKTTDGRRRAPAIPPRRPLNMNLASVRRVVASFEALGHSAHSGNAGTLQYVIDHCEANGISYRLSAKPGQGYFIEKLRKDS